MKTHFSKNHQTLSDLFTQEARSRYLNHEARKRRIAAVSRRSLIDLVLGVLISILKILIGLFTHSIAVLSDAVDALSQAFNSLMLLVSFRLSSKLPDRKHPLGYGRVEYICVSMLAMLTFLFGIHFLYLNIERILHPELSKVSFIQSVLIFLTLFIKAYMYKKDKKASEDWSSPGLEEAAVDDRNSLLTTSLTLISVWVAKYLSVDLDGWIGLIISLFILYSGYKGLRNAYHLILGSPIELKEKDQIIGVIQENINVIGVYDLYFDHLGEGFILSSASIEVNAELSSEQLAVMTNKICAKVYDRFSIDLSLEILPVNSQNPKIKPLCEKIQTLLLSNPEVIQLYGFLYTQNRLILHLLVSAQGIGDVSLYEKLVRLLQTELPDVKIDLSLHSNENFWHKKKHQ